MNDLEKMDALKERMHISYAQAKEALDACGGDVAMALVYLEEQGLSYIDGQGYGAAEDGEEEKWDKEKAEHFVRGIVEQVKTFIREGNVTKVRLISGEKTLFEIPATIGVLGVGIMLFSPLLAILTAFGAATAMMKEMVFEVEKADGTVEKHPLRFPAMGGKARYSEEDEAEGEGDGDVEDGWGGDDSDDA